MSDIELKPCPFCGGKAEMIVEVSKQPESAVFCQKCDAKTAWRHGIDGGLLAAIAWNRRALPSTGNEEKLVALSAEEKQTAITLIEILEARDFVPEAERGLGIQGARRFSPDFAALVRRLLSLSAPHSNAHGETHGIPRHNHDSQDEDKALIEAKIWAFERAKTVLGCDCDGGKKSMAVPVHHFTCVKSVLDREITDLAPSAPDKEAKS